MAPYHLEHSNTKSPTRTDVTRYNNGAQFTQDLGLPSVMMSTVWFGL